MAVNWERHLLRIEGKRGEVRALFSPFRVCVRSRLSHERRGTRLLDSG